MFPSRFGVTLLKCILLCTQLKAWGSWPGLVLFVPPSCARIHHSGGFGTCGDKEPGCSFPWPEGASGCAERGSTVCVCVCVSVSVFVQGLGAAGSQEAHLVSAAFMCKAGTQGSALSPGWNRSFRRSQTFKGCCTLEGWLLVPNAAGASALN